MRTQVGMAGGGMKSEDDDGNITLRGIDRKHGTMYYMYYMHSTNKGGGERTAI